MRLVIADDSLIVREGLTRVLEFAGNQVVCGVGDPDRLLTEVALQRPAVAIIDIKMPPTFTDEGLRVAATIRRRYPDIGVLVLSQYVVAGYATWLLEHSPERAGYLLKDRLLDATVLLEALSRIAAGETVVDPELVQLLMRRHGDAGPLATLTEQERQVLALMAEGLSDRGIAQRLVVSVNTVGTHIKHVYRKLDIAAGPSDNRRVQAALAWLQNT